MTAALQLGARVGPPDAAAADHHRPFGGLQQPGELVDVARVGGGARGDGDRGQRCGGGDIDLEQVERYAEMHRTGSSGDGLGEGPVQVERELGGVRGDGGPLGDVADQANLFDLLEGVALAHFGVAHAAYCDHGAGRGVSGGNTRDGVGMAGAASHDRDAGLPREAGPAVGHVGRGRLVADVDQTKTFAVAHAEKLVEMVADQSEQVGDAEVLERGDEEFCAVGHEEALSIAGNGTADERR